MSVIMNISAEIQVNSHTANDQKFQQITALSDGGWVITWESENQDGSGQGVYAQSYILRVLQKPNLMS